MGRKGIIYSIFTILSVSIFSKIFGFLKETVTANYFGTSLSIDIYYLSYGVFFALSSIVGTSIGLGYISLHSKNKRDFGDKWLDKSYESFNYTLFISFVLAVFFFFCSNSISNVIGGNYDINELQVLSNYIKINSVAFFFQSLTFFLISILNAEKKFGIGEIAGVMYSIVVLICLLFFYNKYGINAIIYSFLISSFITFITLYLYIYKFKYKAGKINFKENSIISLSTLIGTSIIYIGQIYDRSIAANLDEGSLSALNYSGNIHSLINVFFIVSIVNVLYSEFSSIDHTQEDFMHKINHIFNNSIKAFIIILLPITLFLFMFTDQIVSIIFERGKFDSHSVFMTSDVFQMYVLGTIFFAIRDLSNKLFYSLNDRKIPIISGVIFLILNMLLCYILSRYFGVRGISLAVSLTSLLATLFLLRFLKVKHNVFLKNDIYIDMFKVIGFCIITYLTFMNISLDFFHNINKIQRLLYLTSIFCIYIVIYLIYCFVFRIEIIQVLIKKIRK